MIAALLLVLVQLASAANVAVRIGPKGAANPEVLLQDVVISPPLNGGSPCRTRKDLAKDADMTWWATRPVRDAARNGEVLDRGGCGRRSSFGVAAHPHGLEGWSHPFVTTRVDRLRYPDHATVQPLAIDREGYTLFRFAPEERIRMKYPTIGPGQTKVKPGKGEFWFAVAALEWSYLRHRAVGVACRKCVPHRLYGRAGQAWELGDKIGREWQDPDLVVVDLRRAGLKKGIATPRNRHKKRRVETLCATDLETATTLASDLELTLLNPPRPSQDVCDWRVRNRVLVFGSERVATNHPNPPSGWMLLTVEDPSDPKQGTDP